MQLTCGDRVFGENFSHIFPSLEDLCFALWEAGRGLPTRPANLLLEPSELELRIDPVGGGMSEVAIRVFPGSARAQRRAPVFACIRPTREVVMVFWRALRRLQTSAPRATFEREWRGPFPELGMAALTALVEAWKGESRRRER
jgi:hypothetical protein